MCVCVVILLKFQTVSQLSDKQQKQTNLAQFLLLNHGCKFGDIEDMSVKIRVFYCYRET